MLESLLGELPFPAAETYFLRQPSGAYAIWGDRISASGSDFDNEIRTHSVTLELYEPIGEEHPEAHAALQDVLDGNGIRWTKDDRMWFSEERMLCTTYQFTITEVLQ